MSHVVTRTAAATVDRQSAADRKRRTLELKRALAVVGVPLRDDSTLCKCYIDGSVSSEYTAELVAHIAALHKFLYSCTSYAADCHAILPPIAAEYAGPMGGWAAAWNYCKEYQAPLIKAAAIANAGGIPDVWPWLRHAEQELEDECGGTGTANAVTGKKDDDDDATQMACC
jgi:hypothetical protein